MPLPQDSIAGTEFSWLAVDERGFVALFMTAGEGPVPASALAGSASEANVEEELMRLPERSGYELHASYPRPEDFVAIARRGIYAFDWADVHRTKAEATHRYALVAEPKAPIALSQLPSTLQTRARLTPLAGVVFSAAVTAGVAV